MNKDSIYAIQLVSLFIGGLLYGCMPSDEQDISIPPTENKTVNSLLQRSAASSIIDLRDVAVDTLYVDDKNIMGDKRSAAIDSDAQMGRIGEIIATNDSVYVADQQQNCIWVLNKDGAIARKIGRGGRGPNEFGRPLGLANNSSSIFTIASSNARIKIYSNAFKNAEVFNHPVYGGGLTGNKSFSVSESNMYLLSNNSVHSTLVEVHKITAPFDSVASFLPRIIPPNMQPGSYNNVNVDVSNNGTIAASYSGLPYVFLYDDTHELKHTIYLNFADESMPDNPSTKPIRQEEAMGVKSIINGLLVTDEKEMYVFDGKIMYKLSSETNKSDYQLVNAWYFTYADVEKRNDNSVGINATSVTVEGDTAYFGSIFKQYLYRFSLE